MAVPSSGRNEASLTAIEQWPALVDSLLLAEQCFYRLEKFLDCDGQEFGITANKAQRQQEGVATLLGLCIWGDAVKPAETKGMCTCMYGM